jgi:predicted RNase H-like HicB family nuclease
MSSQKINVPGMSDCPPLLLDPQPEGGFTVTSPVLPELITEGDSIVDAVANARDAAAAVIEAFNDLGLPLSPWFRASVLRVAAGREHPTPSL